MKCSHGSNCAYPYSWTQRFVLRASGVHTSTWRSPKGETCSIIWVWGIRAQFDSCISYISSLCDWVMHVCTKYHHDGWMPQKFLVLWTILGPLWDHDTLYTIHVTHVVLISDLLAVVYKPNNLTSPIFACRFCILSAMRKGITGSV